MTPDEAAALVRPSDVIGFPLGPGQPVALIHALGARTDWVSLDVICSMLVDFYELPTLPGVRTLSTFYGPAERMYRDQGCGIEFIPADFRRFATVMEARRPRVMGTTTTPPDADGYLSLSMHSGATVDELRRCGADPSRVLIVEANSSYPHTLGTDEHPHRLHVSEIDVLIHADRPMTELPDGEVTDVEIAIARHARRFIRPGSTLQTGFGAVPSIIATQLAEGDGGDYGVHSEMFTNGLMRLHQAGKVTNTNKGEFVGYSVCTFAGGSTELYEWLDGRDDVRFLPVHVVNDPELIAANRNMVTINGAISVDLYGQVVADSIQARQFSGIGGHEDFIGGAGLELEDRSLVCLPSSSLVNDEVVSRIVPTFGTGLVTTPRHLTDVVVTEFGIAKLRGRTVRERAMALAEIAHPSARDGLRDAASSLS